MTPFMEALLGRGWLAPVDVAFAEMVGRLGTESAPLALLGAAVARAHSGRGHVCADLRMLGGRPVVDWEGEPLDVGDWPSADIWKEALLTSPIVSRGGEAAPLALFGDRVYLHKLAAMEERVAREIAQRTSAPCDELDLALLENGLAREFSEAGSGQADRQRDAVFRAVSRRFSVVTGGPGTGKTTILARCLALIAEQTMRALGRAPRIALAAPTGKAAARMSEAIGACARGETGIPLRCGPEMAGVIPTAASTLHRLLGYKARQGAKFAFGRQRQLPIDGVIVDEASMVGLEMMDALLAAIPERARVILVGDRHQLASVQAGAVLGDICGGLAPWLTELDRSYRFSGALGTLARAVNAGDAREALDLLSAESGGRETIRLEPRDPADACEVAVKRASSQFDDIVREEDPARRLASFSKVGVLCAHRNGPLGALHINSEIERRLLARGARRAGEAWYDGRPVMALWNAPQLGVYNGDIGVACRDPSSGKLEACFAGEDGGIKRIEPGRLGEHETAFAITVHKAQGSEFDEVLVVLPHAPSKVTTRELLYTAVTRARSRVEILGRKEVVAAAIETPTVRFSGLADRLTES